MMQKTGHNFSKVGIENKHRRDDDQWNAYCATAGFKNEKQTNCTENNVRLCVLAYASKERFEAKDIIKCNAEEQKAEKEVNKRQLISPGFFECGICPVDERDNKGQMRHT